MAWSKSPQGLKDLFDACLPERPGVARRQMFGFPAAFVNGNMFAGLFEDQAMARLPPSLAETLTAQGSRPFEPMPGRPMKAYVTIPEAVLEDEAEFARLLDAACAFTAGLPPKAPKPPKRRKA